MGRKRKGDGYNEGKFKEVEYFLKGLRAPLFKLVNFKSKDKFSCPICNTTDHSWTKTTDFVLNVQNAGN